MDKKMSCKGGDVGAKGGRLIENGEWVAKEKDELQRMKTGG